MARTGVARLGRPPRISDTRSHILKVAAGVFARNGFEAASMEEIAAAVGSSKAAIYHYFDSKRTIYDAIIVETMEEIADVLVQAIGAATSPEDKIAAYFDAHIRYQLRNLDAVSTIVQSASMAGRDVTVKEIELRARTEWMFGDILAAGVKDGSFRDLDIPMTQKALMSLVGWLSKWRPAAPDIDADRILTAYLDLVLPGLRAQV